MNTYKMPRMLFFLHPPFWNDMKHFLANGNPNINLFWHWHPPASGLDPREYDLLALLYWLVVSTHLKNISQNGNLSQIGLKIKNVWNHHLVYFRVPRRLCFSSSKSWVCLDHDVGQTLDIQSCKNSWGERCFFWHIEGGPNTATSTGGCLGRWMLITSGWVHRMEKK